MKTEKKRDILIIKGTKENPLIIQAQQFKDAIIKTTWTIYQSCEFINCIRYVGEHCGFERCISDGRY